MARRAFKRPRGRGRLTRVEMGKFWFRVCEDEGISAMRQGKELEENEIETGNGISNSASARNNRR